VPPGDAGALGAALRKVLEDRSLGAALAAAGAIRAATFSMEGLAEHYVDLYRSAISGVAPI